jgi:nitroimidazol reductase NimA-like FMN-containing flavoprotein (pyridoxamine 5'-phosphate oxidase superfamily)
MIGELNNEQIEEFLKSQIIGRIGCHVNGETYVVPVNYSYDGEYIYAHSAEGKKIFFMRENPEVCFEVDHIENMTNWQSVIANGTYEELQGNNAMIGMQLLIDKLSPLVLSETRMSTYGIGSLHPSKKKPDVLKTVSYRIKLLKKTGRFEKSY